MAFVTLLPLYKEFQWQCSVREQGDSALAVLSERGRGILHHLAMCSGRIRGSNPPLRLRQDNNVVTFSHPMYFFFYLYYVSCITTSQLSIIESRLHIVVLYAANE